MGARLDANTGTCEMETDLAALELRIMGCKTRDEALSEYRKYLNAAETPNERRARKTALFMYAYGGIRIKHRSQKDNG